MRQCSRSAHAAFAGAIILGCTHLLHGQTEPVVPIEEYAARRASVAKDLADGILLVPSRFDWKAEDQHGYQQSADFYYLSGLGNVLRAILVLDGPRQQSLLFVAPLPDYIARWFIAPTPHPADSLRLHRILPWDSFPDFLDRRLKEQSGLPIYLPDTATARTPAGIPAIHDVAALWSSSLRQRWPAINLRSARATLDGLRWIKSPGEIAVLRGVGALSAKALRTALRATAPERRQRVVEVAVVGQCISGGGEGPSFWPWTMAGPNAVVSGIFASFVDYHHLDRRMRAGEVIRLDVGCDLMHYRGDVGRTAPVAGRFSAGQREAWDLLVAAYRAGMARMRDGVSSADVIAASVERVRQLQGGVTTELGRSAAAALLAHGGTDGWQMHGVGLESAEGGARPEILRAGMVFAFEPDLLVQGQAFYLEDMILVRSDGIEVLTPGLPYSADEVERTMKH
jgi:Xaa-Pro aminopeptidase